LAVITAYSPKDPPELLFKRCHTLHPSQLPIACATATTSQVFQDHKDVDQSKRLLLFWFERGRLAHQCHMQQKEVGPQGRIHTLKLHGVQKSQPPVLAQSHAQDHVPLDVMVGGNNEHKSKFTQ
jgi:hypothetical protein